MKIYLQDCETLKFIRCDSSWGADINEALDFISIRRATVYGLTELKDAFQILQVETDGVPSRIPAITRQLPVIKLAAAPRPARSARTACVAREILQRIRPSPNWRPAGQILPLMFPLPGAVSQPG